jgi:hypothetical protein
MEVGHFVEMRWVASDAEGVLARDAGGQRVAPGAAKRSRGLRGVFETEPARRATATSLIGVRLEIGVICPRKRLLLDQMAWFYQMAWL